MSQRPVISCYLGCSLSLSLSLAGSSSHSLGPASFRLGPIFKESLPWFSLTCIGREAHESHDGVKIPKLEDWVRDGHSGCQVKDQSDVTWRRMSKAWLVGSSTICAAIHSFDTTISTHTYMHYSHMSFKKHPCHNCNGAKITWCQTVLIPSPEGDTVTYLVITPSSRFLGDMQSPWSGVTPTSPAN